MTALNSEGLLPCPFCGNDGTGPIEDSLQICHSEPDWVQESRHTWSVQCDKCTATMGYSDSEEEAISAWNRRALPPVDGLAEWSAYAYGDPVEKFTGEARWEGVVVAAYLTTKGSVRYVVEVQPQGFQMIAVPSQLRPRIELP